MAEVSNSKLIEGVYVPPKPVHTGAGEWLYVYGQIIVIVCYGLFVKYDHTSLPSTYLNEGEARENVQRFYPLSQDLHVFAFVGFCLSRTAAKGASWSAFAFCWIIGLWAFQWGILSYGFWEQIMRGATTLQKIPLNLSGLIHGDHAAITVMVTQGLLLGRINMSQVFMLTYWEVQFHGMNKALILKGLRVSDVGGGIVNYLFAAFFGIGASYFFQPTRAQAASAERKADQQSTVVAAIGILFFSLYWPAANAAGADGVN